MNGQKKWLGLDKTDEVSLTSTIPWARLSLRGILLGIYYTIDTAPQLPDVLFCGFSFSSLLFLILFSLGFSVGKLMLEW